MKSYVHILDIKTQTLGSVYFENHFKKFNQYKFSVTIKAYVSHYVYSHLFPVQWKMSINLMSKMRGGYHVD